MGQDRINNDLFVAGNLGAQSFTPPNACIADSAMAQNANVNSTKLMHRNYVHYNNAASASNAVADKRPIYRATYTSIGAANINSFLAGAVVPAGSATTVTVKLLKNGTDISSGGIALTNAQIAYQMIAATLSATTLAAGDVLEVQVLLTSGTNYPQGIFAQLIVDETAS